MDANKQYKKKTYGKKVSRTDESTDTRRFANPVKPLMTEEEEKDAQRLELSYDFSCWIIRLYKYLNEGKLSKADKNIIDASERQLMRSATSINANMNETQHLQSDADFLSESSIAQNGARESENWLYLLSDNGYVDLQASDSLFLDCGRINKILIMERYAMLKNIRDELLVPHNESFGIYKDSAYKIKDQMSNKSKLSYEWIKVLDY